MHLFKAPSSSLMILKYNGTPVEFGNSVEFNCESNGLYFEHDRVLRKWNLTCLPGGVWDVPETWPRCVKSKSDPSEIKIKI